MSDSTSTFIGQSMTLVLSDPWDLGEAILWNLLVCDVLKEGVRPASSFGVASEAILLRLRNPFVFNDVQFEYLQGSPRHEEASVNDLHKVGSSLFCSFVRIPVDRVDAQPPLDLSWWRGGGAFLGTLSLGDSSIDFNRGG